MTVRPSIVLACALACAASGCFRTVYRELEPPGATPSARAPARRSAPARNFFLYGWGPHEVVVHAAAECGGAGNVREIRTRRTSGEGMIATFATTGGVEVYSPWTGEVVRTAR